MLNINKRSVNFDCRQGQLRTVSSLTATEFKVAENLFLDCAKSLRIQNRTTKSLLICSFFFYVCACQRDSTLPEEKHEQNPRTVNADNAAW